MELFLFARFHAIEGQDSALATALRDQVAATRAEPGCLAIAAFRFIRDLRLFWIHSRWVDEAAFTPNCPAPTDSSSGHKS
ncbi:MAG TPA: antibiotic biosynthesis monooxygenase family protein [Casimicrobiaceae bacterium]|nr:antibiotic biosynthesis monooxygenase family protein [Casimicrobiaceae bacterium]